MSAPAVRRGSAAAAVALRSTGVVLAIAVVVQSLIVVQVSF